MYSLTKYSNLTQSTDGSAVLEIIARVFSFQKYLIHLPQFAVLLLEAFILFDHLLHLLGHSQKFAIEIQK